MRSFFMHVRRTPQQLTHGWTSHVAKNQQKNAELHAAARLRLQDFLLASADETGERLPVDIRTAIVTVINCKRLTYRYMLFVGLLVAVTDRKYHPRCLQMKAKDELATLGKAAFDARSLCKKVVVPFEKLILKGKLGGSNDPYVSNPARLPMVSPGNDVKGSYDRQLLELLYEVLEFANTSDDATRKVLFALAYAQVLKRPAIETSLLECDVSERAALPPEIFFDFLGAHTQGVSAVVILAAFFRQYYDKGTKVVVHPINESGASPKEVGDIDLKFKDGRSFAVEVKDKPYKDIDVNHACEKALKAKVHKVVFAYGPAAEKNRPHDGALANFWMEKGVELTFMSIGDSLGVALAASDAVARADFANSIAQTLVEMNAPHDVIELFKKNLKEGAYEKEN